MRASLNSTIGGGGSRSSVGDATVDSGFQHWNSPIPYLFGGLALMLGLITVALVILACSYRKSSSAAGPTATAVTSADESGGGDEKAAAQVDPEQPEIVVIMAGDNKPTYLANPILLSSTSTHNHQHLLPVAS